MATTQDTSVGDKENAKLSPSAVTTYLLYKHATKNVLEWGRQRWKELSRFGSNNKKKNGKNASKKNQKKKKGSVQVYKDMTLASQVALLQQIVAQDPRMEASVFGDLQTAIKLREKMESYYKKLPTTTEMDLEGHSWILDQFRSVRAVVVANEHERLPFQDAKNATGTNGEDKRNNRFSLLAIATCRDGNDDHDEERDSHNKEVAPSSEPTDSTASAPTAASATSKPPSPDAIKAEERVFAIACAVSDIRKTRHHLRSLWEDWAKKAVSLSQHSSSSNGCQNQKDDDGVNCKCDSMDSAHLLALSLFTDGWLTGMQRLASETQVRGLVRSEAEFVGMILDVVDEEDDDTFESLRTIHSILCAGPTLGGESPNAAAYYPDPLPAADILLPAFVANLPLQGLRDTIAAKDLYAFVRLLVLEYFPTWELYGIVLAENHGMSEVDALIFYQWSEIKRTAGGNGPPVPPFQLLVMCLALADSAFAQSAIVENGQKDGTSELISRVLSSTVRDEEYELVADRFDTKHTYSEFYKQIDDFAHKLLPMVSQLPYYGGCRLHRSFGRHLTLSLALPSVRRDRTLVLIHIYRMLRNEGFLGRIPVIEDSLISLFGGKVFFGAGTPRRGRYFRNVMAARGYPVTNLSCPPNGKRRVRGGDLLMEIKKRKDPR